MKRRQHGTWLLPLALLLATAPAAAGDDEATPVIEGVDTQARIANAADMEFEDALGLAKALIAIGDQKLKGDPLATELEFLVEYAVREECRLLRTLAIDSAVRLDKKLVFAGDLFAKHADGEHVLRTVNALEGVARTGTKAHTPMLLELTKSPSELIAIRACDAIANINDKKALDGLIEVALSHPSAHVADHATWAAQDIGKKQKAIIGRLRKGVNKDDEREIRMESIVAMLADESVEPHAYPKDLAKLRKRVLAAPAEVEIKAAGSTQRKGVQEALDWMKKELPGGYLTVQVGAARVDCPGSEQDGHIDLDDYIVQVPRAYSLQKPTTLSYHILRIATVLLQKRMEGPYKSHRGWEYGILETFELCRVGRMHDVSKGSSRDRFLNKILDKRPWGGQ